MTPEQKERTRLEALALRHVFTLHLDDRPDAAARLDAATMELVLLMRAVARTLKTSPGAELADVAAMLGGRALKGDAEAMAAAGVDLDPMNGYNPAELADAYTRVLADTERLTAMRQAEEAERLLAKVKDAKTPAETRALFDAAAARLTRAEQATEDTLAEAWERHRDNLKAEKADSKTVLRLDKTRGPWACWFNDWLGPRAGLERGQTFILGGAPEAGKTSLASVLAVDALAANCPVLFWQLELGREETLEHLQAQHPDPARWWTIPFWKRAHRDLPAGWADLLTVPQYPEPEAEAIRAAILNQARKAERDRRAGKDRHACNGLVIVDYAQLLTIGDKGPSSAQHDVLATAASRLAKAAAESGAVLLILSQLNKQDQKDGKTVGTALAGADLARMAHRVALLNKATDNGKPDGTPLQDDTKGEARTLTWTKARGKRYENGRPPELALTIWNGGQSRAWHGGDEPEPKKSSWNEP